MSRRDRQTRESSRSLAPANHARLLWAVVVLLTTPACPAREGPGGIDVRDERVAGERIVVSDGWLAMGTFFEADLRVVPADEEDARDWLERQRERIDRLESVYSRYRPESRVSVLNGVLRRAAPDRAHSIDPRLACVLSDALAVWRASDGAFDPTVGPLVGVWRDAADRDAWPSTRRLAAVVDVVGGDGLVVLPDGRLVAARSGVSIDLDGISKGAVLDELGHDFEGRFPVGAALLGFGQSSLLAIGDPDGGGWRVEARSRDPERGRLGRLVLRDQALSVSSSVGSRLRIAGRDASHVIDPRTGQPVEGSVEAIVVSDSASIADAWSTALLVLGATEDALERVENGRVRVSACSFAPGRRAADTASESANARSQEDDVLEAVVWGASGRRAATQGWFRHVLGELDR